MNEPITLVFNAKQLKALAIGFEVGAPPTSELDRGASQLLSEVGVSIVRERLAEAQRQRAKAVVLRLSIDELATLSHCFEISIPEAGDDPASDELCDEITSIIEAAIPEA